MVLEWLLFSTAVGDLTHVLISRTHSNSHTHTPTHTHTKWRELTWDEMWSKRSVLFAYMHAIQCRAVHGIKTSRQKATMIYYLFISANNNSIIWIDWAILYSTVCFSNNKVLDVCVCVWCDVMWCDLMWKIFLRCNPARLDLTWLDLTWLPSLEW